MLRRLPAKLFSAMAVLLLATIASALDLPELAARAKPAVVLLIAMDVAGQKIGTGTGFFVSTDGRLVTNHHVIEGASSVTATLSDGSTRKVVGLLADDAVADIALLKVEGGEVPALVLGDSKNLKPGDEIAVIGSPRGLSGTLSSGIVSAVRENGPTVEAKDSDNVQSWGIQITAAISPGSSGSPIMNRGGEVVAVAVGSHQGGQGLNFGVPVEVVKVMIGKLGPGSPVVAFDRAGSGELRRNLMISLAVFAGIGLAYVLWSRYESRRRPRPLRDGD
jgi:S1-C subfamily serine protease